MFNKIKNFGCKVVLCVLFAGVLGVADNSTQAAVFSTNITSPGAGTVFTLIQTNGVKLNQITLANSTTNVLLVSLYDSASNTNTYTNGVYTNYVTISTNINTTNISPFNGYTNIITNIGVFTAPVTNAAATNTLPASTYAVAGSQVLVIPVNLLYERGIVATFNTNSTIILNYSQQ